MTKESGVYQRHSRRCPRNAVGRGYAPHRCTGTWSYVIDVGRDANDERRQETKGGFPTKREAVEQRRKRLGELRTRTGEAYGTTVAAYVEQWLSWKRGLRDSTRLSYRQHLDDYLVPALGHYRLADLERRPELIEQMFSNLVTGVSGKPLAPASVRRIYSTLRSAQQRGEAAHARAQPGVARRAAADGAVPAGRVGRAAGRHLPRRDPGSPALRALRRRRPHGTTTR